MAAAAAGGDQGGDQGGWQGWRGRDRDDEWRREKRSRSSGDEDDDFPDIDLRRPVPNDSI